MRGYFVVAPVAFLLMFGTFLLCGNEARAKEPLPVRYGLNMGLNFGKLQWPDIWVSSIGVDDRLPAPKMRAGLVAEFFTPRPGISIVTGFDYRMTREKYHASGGNTWFDRMGTYLTVPVLFKYTPGEVKGIYPFVDLGPQVAFTLAFSGKDDEPGPTSIPMEMTQYGRRVSMELRGGGGIEFPMSGMFTGVIETSYESGLTSITKASLNLPVKTRNLFFSMGVRF